MPVVENRVGLADLEAIDGRLAHGVVRLVSPDRALRRVRRTGRVVDQRPVRPGRPRRDGRVRGAPQSAEEIVGGRTRRVPGSERRTTARRPCRAREDRPPGRGSRRPALGATSCRIWLTCFSRISTLIGFTITPARSAPQNTTSASIPLSDSREIRSPARTPSLARKFAKRRVSASNSPKVIRAPWSGLSMKILSGRRRRSTAACSSTNALEPRPPHSSQAILLRPPLSRQA